MKISYSKTFEKKFSKYDRKLQEKIFNAIQKLPDGDVKRLTGNDIPPIYRISSTNRKWYCSYTKTVSRITRYKKSNFCCNV